MAHLTIPQIYSTWVGVGGNTGYIAIYATAIALAESGGYDHAVSPSADHGLWQINVIWAPVFPRLWPDRYDPHANARMAKSISGNGINWGPWCTAYKDPSFCGQRRLSRPETGSPAGNLVSHVAAVIGSHDPGTAGTAGGDLSDHLIPGDRGWAKVTHILGPGGASWADKITASSNYLKGVGK